MCHSDGMIVPFSFLPVACSVWGGVFVPSDDLSESTRSAHAPRAPHTHNATGHHTLPVVLERVCKCVRLGGFVVLRSSAEPLTGRSALKAHSTEPLDSNTRHNNNKRHTIMKIASIQVDMSLMYGLIVPVVVHVLTFPCVCSPCVFRSCLFRSRFARPPSLCEGRRNETCRV